MAYLVNKESGFRCYLVGCHSFGRLAQTVDTHIANPEISKIHALLEWEQTLWSVRDVSKNGTWLNDTQLLGNRHYPLALGDVIHFTLEKTISFVVEDLSPPSDLLIPCDESDGRNVDALILDGYSIFPSSEAPELAVYFDHKTMQWYQEKLTQSDSRPVILNDNDIVEIGNSQWRLQQSRVEEPTKDARDKLHLKDLKFFFNLSQDEEVTQVKLLLGNEIIDLHTRAHHYLSLMLARYRVADADSGVDEFNQGWVYTDQITKDLGIDPGYLNIQIHRARKQFADAVNRAVNLDYFIQRQPGKVRFGANQFEISKGQNFECALNGN